jgi:hypothetical protein
MSPAAHPLGFPDSVDIALLLVLVFVLLFVSLGKSDGA